MFPNFWSHSLCPRFWASTQLRGFLTPGCIMFSNPIPTLVEPEQLIQKTSVWMSRVVRRWFLSMIREAPGHAHWQNLGMHQLDAVVVKCWS